MGNRARLRRAAEDKAFVRIVRSPRHADDIDGFVVAIGERWAVIQATLEGGYFDGYSAFRLKDLVAVKRQTGFGGDFARTLPTWPPRCPEGLVLDSTKDVVRTMAQTSELIGIEAERQRRAIWIGEVFELSRTWTWLWEVRPNATWQSEPLGYRTKRITLISIDSMYQRALAEVAGPSGRTLASRGHAVQADLGAISGGQASLYRQATACAEALGILDGLAPLRVDADPDGSGVLRAKVRRSVEGLVDEFDAAGGPNVQRVDSYFGDLTGQQPPTGRPSADAVEGQLGALRDRFGLVDENVNTIEEEAVRASFWTLVDLVTDLQAVWTAEHTGLGRTTSHLRNVGEAQRRRKKK